MSKLIDRVGDLLEHGYKTASPQTLRDSDKVLPGRGNTIGKCKHCGAGFRYSKSNNKKFCNKSCYTKYQSEVGYSHAYQKGHKESPRGEQHHNWKGDSVGYSAVHSWLRRQLGKPSKCEHCLRTDQPKYEWANISKEYKRDPSDWKRLCKKCHIAYDEVSKKAWKTKVKRGTGGGWTFERKTHCIRGHEYSDDNTYYYKTWAHCRLCRKIREDGYENAKRG